MTKILLVEDDKSLREIYGVRLLAEGYDIVSAGDGEEALAMAIKERPQLIVSDVMMPKISGFDMLDILRSTTETKDIKVIMMTALSSEDQRQRGESLGADRYLVKSQVGIEDVVRTVHEVLGDAPVTNSVAGGNAFMTPRGPQPSPAPGARPMPTPAPTPMQPAPRPQQPPAQAPPQPAPHTNPLPVQPAPQPQPQATQPMPQPQTPPPAAPPQPTNLPQPEATAEKTEGLPEPTAPFSTPRPIGLGDRIIHPLQHPDAPRDMNNLMAQELKSASPGLDMSGQTPAAPSAPFPQHTTPTPSAQPEAKPNLSFEETPLPNPSHPQAGASQQPPQPQQ